MRATIILFGILAVIGFSFAAQNVSSCQIINASDTYVLTSDLVGSPISSISFSASFTCLRVDVSNVVVDCNGHTVTNNISDFTLRSGIESYRVKNVTFRNCNVSQYSYCIALWRTNDSLVMNNSVSNCSQAGIQLATTGPIAGNGSINNTITNNTARDSGFGMSLYFFSDNNNVSGNTAFGNTNDGLRIEISNNNKASNNVFFNNSDGIIISGGTNNEISGNEFYGNTRTGMEAAGGTANIVTGNYAHDIDGSGFFFFNGETSLLAANNTAVNCTRYGVEVDGTTFSLIQDNFLDGNNNGIFIRSDNNTFTGNTVLNSAGFGIELQGAENNTLSDNLVQESGGFDLSLVPYDLPDDCNNVVTNMTGSGGNPILYAGNALLIASGGTYSEIALCKADSADISGITVAGSPTLDNNGILVVSSGNVSLDNIVSSDNLYGLLLSDSPGALVSGLTACGNAQAGLEEFNAVGPASTVSNSLFCGNAWEIGQDSFNSVLFTLDNVSLGNVTLSLSDEVGSGGGGYRINDTTAPGPAPAGYASFGGKYLKVLFTGDLGINTTVFHWSPSEVSGITESTLRLFTWNNTGWVLTPNQALNLSSSSISVNSLINITSDDIYGLFYTSGSTDGGDGGTSGGGTPALTLDFESACGVSKVTVRGSGVYQEGADVKVNGSSAGTTDSAGTVSFDSECGMSMTIEASKPGFESASATVSTVSCGLCAECSSDAQCAPAERCQAGQCTPLQCAPGESADNHGCVRGGCTSDSECGAGMFCDAGACRQKPPQCEPPSCCTSDSQCGSSQKCTGGSCVDIVACGKIENHAVVETYECGAPGCPSCPSGTSCIANKCAGGDVSCPTTGIVGEEKTCIATEGGLACKNCDYQITAPDGKVSSGKTDEQGNIALPLLSEGTYQVSILKGGAVVKTIQVKALASTAGTGTKPPTAAGGFDPASLLWLLIIVLIIGGALIYLRSRPGRKS
ncbi:MAG TPA: right-handed parallel beta-helix repeat-containing protein [Candidatus Bilamarchaeum sp.]|nr:right-handed parallel beta-helix repeat-containing protein [Candidatus Bilamarchaeum sp.]